MMTHDRHAHERHGRDWRLWNVVGLMLLSMVLYVFTMDEELQPGGSQQPLPAQDVFE